jgi:hypothetical protein
VDALAGGLLQMIEDEEGRRLMAANALQTARGYDISMIADRWEKSFAELGR